MFGATSPISLQPSVLREGMSIIQAHATLHREHPSLPVRIEITSESGKTLDSLIVLPNLRLQEMESIQKEDPEAIFSITGNIYSCLDENYILLREVLLLQEFAKRNHPEFAPIDPNAESLPVDAGTDSIADIIRDLEDSVGPLVKSIRGAAESPLKVGYVPKEGSRIQSRRCHLVRNEDGAWVALFVADSMGLSDPPATILPGRKFQQLTTWISKQHTSTPVLLTGELLTYHGHSFLVLKSWRRVHQTDHL